MAPRIASAKVLPAGVVASAEMLPAIVPATMDQLTYLQVNNLIIEFCEVGLKSPDYMVRPAADCAADA